MYTANLKHGLPENNKINKKSCKFGEDAVIRQKKITLTQRYFLLQISLRKNNNLGYWLWVVKEKAIQDKLGVEEEDYNVFFKTATLVYVFESNLDLPPPHK